MAAALPAEPVPEVPTSEVARWREAGGRTVDLLVRAHRLGPVSAVPLGGPPTVLATSPAAVQQVLARRADRYVKRSHRMKHLLGEGLIAASGERWQRQRRLLQPRFTVQGIRRYEQPMRDAARRTVRDWTDSARTGRPRDLADDMQRFSFDVIWRCVTGLPVDEDTRRQWRAADRIVTAVAALGPAAGHPQPDAGADLAEVEAVAERAVAAARAGSGPSLLDVLFSSGAGQTPRQIRDELVTLLVAGYETTATTLLWLLLLLHEHPDRRTEVLSHGPAGSPARTEAIRALVRETLRLYPTAWLMPRHALEDDILDGHRIHAGTTVLICPYLTHRAPDVWPDPLGFRPGRFLGRASSSAPGAYHPFGLGPRACLGAQFSLQEMTILLEALLPAFEFTLEAPPPEPVFGITIHPDGPAPATITARG
ncbi:cytochrome P450 [Streptomyces sp. NPDC093094]|uniref:cytochrome P450 n=1 Tax=Streptomyces sp. NPDC093094 TaxID=3366026 RepID=UPI0037F25D73